ncbi:hypothetical protein A2U01_0072779, partial [Trifolium medium]|nr:hypothetical protein [Trifolium medium]
AGGEKGDKVIKTAIASVGTSRSYFGPVEEQRYISGCPSG